VERRGDASRLLGQARASHACRGPASRTSQVEYDDSDGRARKKRTSGSPHCFCGFFVTAHKLSFKIFLLHSSVLLKGEIMGLIDRLATMKMDFLPVEVGSHCSDRNGKDAEC
jgi:hypothetical protein